MPASFCHRAYRIAAITGPVESAYNPYFSALNSIFLSQRINQNSISACFSAQANGATVNDVQPINHQEKSQSMTEYYKNILGVQDTTAWNFDVTALYSSAPTPDLSALVSPFSEAEALQAVKSMNANSAPGPDGFGPAWYSSAWSFVKVDVMDFLSKFYSGPADLNCINRAHIVLLPKCQGATAPKDFRPISLQNCPIKIITKILTTRLQRLIHQLVDMDQTGFIKGRSISENFVYATKLVQHCHHRKHPTVVLKLDFAKAFESVSWDSLMLIL
jgi:hypothetical protein